MPDPRNRALWSEAIRDRAVSVFLPCLITEDQGPSPEEARLMTALLGIGPAILATLPGGLPKLGVLRHGMIASPAGVVLHVRDAAPDVYAAVDKGFAKLSIFPSQHRPPHSHFHRTSAK